MITWLLMLSNPLQAALALKKPEAFCEVQSDGRILCGQENPSLQAITSICQGFLPIAGDVSHASRILLGEYHPLRNVTATCVDKLTEKSGEHLVLLENVPSGEKIDCQDKGISRKKGRTCRGWDDENELDKLVSGLAIGRQSVYLDELESNYAKKKLPDKEFDKIVKENLAEIIKGRKLQKNQFFAKHLQNHDFSGMQNFYEKILAGRNQKKSYPQIFKDLKKITPGLHDKTPNSMLNSYETTALARNKMLVKTMRQHPSPLTVVVAGSAHLTGSGARGKKNEAAEYVQRELEKDKDQNPFAILAME